jgi:hypothetical protein
VGACGSTYFLAAGPLTPLSKADTACIDFVPSKASKGPLDQASQRRSDGIVTTKSRYGDERRNIEGLPAMLSPGVLSPGARAGRPFWPKPSGGNEATNVQNEVGCLSFGYRRA